MILISSILDLSTLLDLSALSAYVSIMNAESGLVRGYIKSRHFSYLTPMRTILTILLFFCVLSIIIRAVYFRLQRKFWTLRMVRFNIFYKIFQSSSMAICILMVNEIYNELLNKYNVFQYETDKEKTSDLQMRMFAFQSIQTITTTLIVSFLTQTAALLYKNGKLETWVQ
eukprot:NODE_817_length_3729_cov_0.988154.p3 type:complete len:170 gc:universal NODE_817_length_3729_cov_0.988154:2293-1784(-)